MEYSFSEIGERIRAERKINNLSQEDLIEKLKTEFNFAIARNTLSKIENGVEKYFSLDFMLAVCRIFDWDMGFLLGEYEETTIDVHNISEYTGLSERSIRILHREKKRADQDKNGGWLSIERRVLQALNVLIENNAEIFFDISDFLYFRKFNSLSVIPDGKEHPNIRDDNGDVDEIEDREAYINGEYWFEDKTVPASTVFDCADTPDLLLLKVQNKLIKLREKISKRGENYNG